MAATDRNRDGSLLGRRGTSTGDGQCGGEAVSNEYAAGGHRVVLRDDKDKGGVARLTHPHTHAARVRAREWALTAVVLGNLACHAAVLLLPLAAAGAWLGGAPAVAVQGLGWAWVGALGAAAVPVLCIAAVRLMGTRVPVPVRAAAARVDTWLSVAWLRVSAWTGRRPYWTPLPLPPAPTPAPASVPVPVASGRESWLWLGSLPLPSDVPRLRALGVRHVVNLCDEYDVRVHPMRKGERQTENVREGGGHMSVCVHVCVHMSVCVCI
jgi:hypothetical protein